MKLFRTAGAIICWFFVIWFVLSLCQIIMQNGAPNPVYSNYNLIVAIIRQAANIF